MGLRAIIVSWNHTSGFSTSERSSLRQLLAETRTRFPADAERPNADTPVPSSTIAVALYSTAPSVTLTPWDDPPLAAASRVVCFESADEALLNDTAQHCHNEFGDSAAIDVMPVEVRDRRYTSATIATIAYDPALGRQSKEEHPEVLLWPCRRTTQWWDLTPMQRQALFLPRLGANDEVVTPGHVLASEPIVPIVHRRLYHDSLPDGAPGVMVGWFETSPAHLEALRAVVADLQRVDLVPDHAYYQSGPLCWGRRLSVESLEAELASG
jgi:hypothetical protein